MALEYVKRSNKRFPWHLFDTDQAPKPLGLVGWMWNKSVCGSYKWPTHLLYGADFAETIPDEEQILVCRNCLKVSKNDN